MAFERAREPMYNLLVTGNLDNWHGEPWEIELSRCVREYTETDITDRFGSLDRGAVNFTILTRASR